jgi:hypothetical protein
VLYHLYARVIIPQAVLGELQDAGTPAKVKEVGGFASSMA